MRIKADTTLKKSHSVMLSNVEVKLLGLDSDARDDTAYVALKYFDEEFECFSEWDKSELKAFTKFIKKINQMTWTQIISQGGRPGSKVGMGYTVHKNPDLLPNKELRERLSRDITFFELRVTKKARVHGFKVKNTFFLVWLDRLHRIYPQ